MTRSGALGIPLLAAAVALATAGAAGAEEIVRHFHESFDVPEGASLHLDHGDGDVEIAVWDRDVIEIDVTYRAGLKQGGIGKLAQPDFEVEFSREGDAIRVVGREPPFRAVVIGYVARRVHEYRYEVRAPAWLSVETRGDDGSVTVRGLGGRLDCRLEDGDLELADCALARARLVLEDGAVTTERCAGEFEIRTEDGDVRLRSHGAGPLRVRSTDGDVRLELVAAGGADLDVEVEDGDVTVSLAESVSARFQLLTEDGRIRVGVAGIDRFEKSDSGATGEIRGGVGTIRIRSEDGAITLREAG
jgi:hypothetical protein